MLSSDLATRAEDAVILLLTEAGLVAPTDKGPPGLPLLTVDFMPSTPERVWTVSCYQTSNDINPDGLDQWADIQVRVRELGSEGINTARAAIDEALNVSNHPTPSLMITRMWRRSWAKLGADTAGLHEATFNYRLSEG